jgi:transcriptional regulator with XRE-family HTH domain
MPENPTKVPLRERRKLLRLFRKQNRMSLSALGELAGLSQPMLSQFENGDRDLSEEAWTRVLDAMEKFLLRANANYKAEIAQAQETAAKLGARPYRGFKEALEHIDLKSLLEHSSKVLEEKKSQAERLKSLSSIDDPVIAEIMESFRREIIELERQATSDVELHDAPLYVQKMWHAMRGYRELLPSLSADALAGLSAKQRQALEEWYSVELTKQD